MGKLSKRKQPLTQQRHQLHRLQGERRKLTARLAMVDAKISKLQPPRSKTPAMTASEFERWLDDLAQSSDDTATSLPFDFSRADIYDDHD